MRIKKSDQRKVLKNRMTTSFIPIANILNGIAKRSRNIDLKDTNFRKFDDLYSLLCNEILLIQASGNIKSNKGSMTPGISYETIDAMSLERIKDLSNNMKNHNFIFSSIRRKYIIKPKLYTEVEPPKYRPLGIPNFSDRIIQEAIRIILEAMYEPIFEKIDANYGFRTNKSCHHAIVKLKRFETGSTPVIEGDIEGAYDNVNHYIMIEILKKRTNDSKFLNLLFQGFRAGILDKRHKEDTLLRVPQAGLASPILFNIY